MADGSGLKANAWGRVRAAETLIQSGDYDIAIELLSFALECGLKSCICKTLGLKEYPDRAGKEVGNFFKTHDFDRLLLLSGFQQEFEFKPGNLRKFRNWSYATNSWDTSKRYEIPGQHSGEAAQRLLTALTNPTTGVITWIEENQKW